MNHRIPIRQVNPKIFICTKCLFSTSSFLYDIQNASPNRVQQILSSNTNYDIIKNLKDTYPTIKATFLEDLTKLNKENLPSKFLIKKVPSNYLMTDLVEVITREDEKLVMQSVKLLKGEYILPKNFRISDSISQIRRNFLHYLINTNQLSLATTLLLQYKENNIKYYDQDISLLINVIKNSSIRDFPINSYCNLQVIENFKLNTLDLYKSLKYLTSIQIGQFYSNYLYFKLHEERTLQDFSSKQFNSILISMLRINFENNNIIKALQIWKISKDMITNIPEAETKELVKLITEIFKLHHDQNSIAKEIETVPDFINDLPEFLNYRLDYYSTHSVLKFKELIKQLSSPLKRSSLTSLLNGFITIGDELNSEKIIEIIFQHSNLNQDELNLIVEKLLQEKKLNEALSMIRRMNLEISKKSYLTIFRHVEDLETDQNKIQSFYKELFLKFMKLNFNDEILQSFTIEIIKKLSQIDNKQASRYLIKFMQKLDFQIYQINKIENFIDFGKYKMLNEFEKLLSLNNFGIIECLKIVSRQALSDKDNIILRWSINEFRKSGWEISTITEYLSYYDDQNYLKRVLKKRAFIDLQ